MENEYLVWLEAVRYPNELPVDDVKVKEAIGFAEEMIEWVQKETMVNG